MKKATNKSQKIRALREKNPAIKVSEIMAQMEKEGTPVSGPLVYQALRTSDTPKKRGRKPGIAKTTKSVKKRGPKKGLKGVKAITPSAPSVDLFASMQNFVNAAGSLEKAVDLLNLFRR